MSSARPSPRSSQLPLTFRIMPLSSWSSRSSPSSLPTLPLVVKRVPFTYTLPKPVTAPTLVPWLLALVSAEPEEPEPPPPQAARPPTKAPATANLIAFESPLRFMFHLQADFTQSGACSLRADRLGYFSRSEEHTSELQSRPHLVCRL